MNDDYAVIYRFRVMLPDLPEKLRGSIIEDHVMVALHRLACDHSDEFANLILLAAMEGYEECRDYNEDQARLQAEAAKEFADELNARGVVAIK